MSFNNNKGEYKFPYDIVPVDPATNAELLKYFDGERTRFVHVGAEKYFFPGKYKDAAEHFFNFQARPDDIWIATFPRSGTTWTQELIWLISNNLDFEKARQQPLSQRFPFFEFSNFMHDDIKKELLALNADDKKKMEFIEMISVPGYTFFPQMQHQRFIKTHFPFSLLPPSVMEQQCKIIYVARNPKDVAVSYYHLNRLYRTQGYVGDFEKFWDFFERGLTPWAPFWSHLKEGWSNRNKSNVLFMFYEDMVQNFSETIKKVSKFLGKSLNDNQVAELEEYLKIENFKKNDAVNGKELRDVNVTYSSGFVRNGKIDGWQNEYTPELRTRAEKWIEQNLKETDMRFPTY